MNTFNKLKEIIVVVLENSSLNLGVDILETSNLRDDLSMDSLALAELSVRVEDEFDVDVFEDGLVSTVAEILEKL
jgi:acyl carrier protein